MHCHCFHHIRQDMKELSVLTAQTSLSPCSWVWQCAIKTNPLGQTLRIIPGPVMSTGCSAFFGHKNKNLGKKAVNEMFGALPSSASCYEMYSWKWRLVRRPLGSSSYNPAYSQNDQAFTPNNGLGLFLLPRAWDALLSR